MINSFFDLSWFLQFLIFTFFINLIFVLIFFCLFCWHISFPRQFTLLLSGHLECIFSYINCCEHIIIEKNANFLRTPIFGNINKRLLLKSYLIFRRYFRRSSLSAFYKIGILKTYATFLGKYICRSPFSIKLQTFSGKFY